MELRQGIRFCTSTDGTRIAVASCGQGPVILRAAHWLSHCHHDVDSPVWRPWLQALSARHRFIRYDPRGCGLSDRFVAVRSLGISSAKGGRTKPLAAMAPVAAERADPDLGLL